MTTDQIDRLLTVKEVLDMVALGKTKLYDMIQLEEFPEPIKLGSLSRWSLLEVQEWIAQQKTVKMSYFKQGFNLEVLQFNQAFPSNPCRFKL